MPADGAAGADPYLNVIVPRSWRLIVISDRKNV
jgi:hypothetical protein